MSPRAAFGVLDTLLYSRGGCRRSRSSIRSRLTSRRSPSAAYARSPPRSIVAERGQRIEAGGAARGQEAGGGGDDGHDHDGGGDARRIRRFDAVKERAHEARQDE